MRSIFTWGWGLVVVVGAAGCADLLGIEEWQDPASSQAGGGNAGGAGGNETVDTGGTGGATADGCKDGLQNGTESGVDCGGDTCAACNNGGGCVVDDDCASRYCQAERGYCISDDGRGQCGMPDTFNPNCADCVKNGLETDVDCGGSCAPCRAGKVCTNGSECWSGVCAGSSCALGPKGTPCFTNDDCESASCGSLGCASGFCCQ